ncbi:MAG: hypothetical protein EOP62_05700 [Sphingomonadales bacterium]|nr:MAG: hypothetical protein EOP62_05700 [Sphingomonadales bacterium]
MDEAKRTELYARREALIAEAERQDRIKRRAELVALVPILTALEAAGDDYDSDNFGVLSGPLNWWACHPDRYPMRQYARGDLPADPVARDAMILAALRERLGAGDRVTLILRSEDFMLTMRMPVLIRHLDTLFENAKGDWLAFAAPPADWILATYHDDTLAMSYIVNGTLVEE